MVVCKEKAALHLKSGFYHIIQHMHTACTFVLDEQSYGIFQ